MNWTVLPTLYKKGTSSSASTSPLYKAHEIYARIAVFQLYLHQHILPANYVNLSKSNSTCWILVNIANHWLYNIRALMR